MELWTAFGLGFVGSLHCAGMCGPLVMALPVIGQTPWERSLSRVLYNVGRIVTYCLLGLAFGLLGQTFALAGLQRWVSLIAGTIILLSLVATSRFSWGTPAVKSVVWLKASLARRLQQRTLGSLFVLGALNGLLPCGLVYVAGAAAAASTHYLGGAEYMAAFGLGTVPMMFGISVAGKRVLSLARFKPQRLIPLSLAIVGTLLILRGLSLGIPYLSPEIGSHEIRCPLCN